MGYRVNGFWVNRFGLVDLDQLREGEREREEEGEVREGGHDQLSRGLVHGQGNLAG